MGDWHDARWLAEQYRLGFRFAPVGKKTGHVRSRHRTREGALRAFGERVQAYYELKEIPS